MNNQFKGRRVLLIENETGWVDKIINILDKFGSCEIKVVNSYDEAEILLSEGDISQFAAAIIDIRMRKPIYDQGGLALLDLIKAIRPEIPTLILTAYAGDYPGLGDITTRYPRVYTFEKEVFIGNYSAILEVLFTELPPQIGDGDSKMPKQTNQEKMLPTTFPLRAGTSLRDVLIGGAVIILILGATGLVLLMFEYFSSFPFQMNVLFSVVIIFSICLLLQFFGLEIVEKAVTLCQNLFGKEKKQHGGKENPD